MASYITNFAKSEFAKGNLQIGTHTFKVMLCKASTGNSVDLNTIADFTGAGCTEADATNYTGGFAGAGRKTATLASAEDDTNDRANITITGSLTWTALGGASNNTITAALLVREITNDAGSTVVAFLDLTDTPTNGGDFVLTWASSLVATLT